MLPSWVVQDLAQTIGDLVRMSKRKERIGKEREIVPEQHDCCEAIVAGILMR